MVLVKGGEPVQVTDRKSLNLSPVWMPDGKRLVLAEVGPSGIFGEMALIDGKPKAAIKAKTVPALVKELV